MNPNHQAIVMELNKRERIPRSEQFGRDGVRALANRFYALSSKARTKGIPFAWQKLTPFIRDLEALFPGKEAGEFRLKFDLGDPRGYCRETIILDASPRARREPVDSALATEIAVLLTTEVEEDGEMRPLSETVEMAAANI